MVFFWACMWLLNSSVYMVAFEWPNFPESHLSFFPGPSMLYCMSLPRLSCLGGLWAYSPLMAFPSSAHLFTYLYSKVYKAEWVSQSRQNWAHNNFQVRSVLFPFVQDGELGCWYWKTRLSPLHQGGGGTRMSKSTMALSYSFEDVFSWLDMLGCCKPLIVCKAPTKFVQIIFGWGGFVFCFFFFDGLWETES